MATGGLSFLAETLARRATADPRPCETANGATPAPAGQEPPKQEGSIGQFFQGLFRK